jgi:DNA-binding response OmpR family regulator
VSDIQGKKLLAIDDDPIMLRLVEHTFSKTGALVYVANNGEEGLRQLYACQPDLVILDVMMPNLDGWQVCARIRQISEVSIIFLTALGKEDEIIRGLDCGAVDYVTKPFSPKVLVARAQAALRRGEPASGPKKRLAYRDDYLTIDLEMRRVLVGGKPVQLTATEYKLLAYLVLNASQVLTFGQILENVWGKAYQDSVNYVHIYVWHLRQKLEAAPRQPQYLITEHGVGYRFQNRPDTDTGRRQGWVAVE